MKELFKPKKLNKTGAEMLVNIEKKEMVQAQAALLFAIFLQFVVWRTTHGINSFQIGIIAVEILMLAIVSFSSNVRTSKRRAVHQYSAVVMLGLMSAANLSSLILVIDSLIRGDSALSGLQLLASAMAIFATNIIIFALWYWEIDSPGLTKRRWSAKDKDFQFTQQDSLKSFPDWKPEFVDYFYLSLTNAINFAPADARPVTHGAKMLMAVQSLISVFTIALVVARSVSILG